MSMQGSLSIERMCQLAQVSRAGFYRSLAEQKPLEEEMEVRAAIQRIALEHRRRYGYRRIAAELRRQGMLVNHKRVARIMREDNLLAVRSKSFVTTTDSSHELEVYLNLARRLQLSGINQLWVADITYIRLQREFVYLAAILDAFSRKVVGWALETTLGRPAYANDYRDLDHLRSNIEDFIERYYNRCRLHSALGYRPPEEFEQAARSGDSVVGATMSFFRHPEIYRSEGNTLLNGKPTEAGLPRPSSR
jgi:transposase InsO family protein